VVSFKGDDLKTIKQIVDYLESIAPLQQAAEWDNVGLLLGESSTPVSKILTCLTVTPEVVAEAIAQQVSLIVTHHPILFKGTKKFSDSSTEGRLLWPLAKAGISVYSAHTAFDDAKGGINDSLADLLDLQDRKPLRVRPQESSFKVVVFVPISDRDKVLNAMFAAGAGNIGEYRECSYRVSGTGTFFPTDNTNPTIGKIGQREEVAEERLEVVCPESQLSNVIQAMRSSHSYEEPAFDVYPLRSLASNQGQGRLGHLKTELTLREIGKLLRVKLECGPVQLIGDANSKIKTIALACGAAGEYLSDAIRKKVDCFITGEMRFHDYLLAQSQGVHLVLPGHYATERFAMVQLAQRLAGIFPEIEARASQAETDPVTWS
jgi:dinuclear metal center YbgI/SA1388 family protein